MRLAPFEPRCREPGMFKAVAIPDPLPAVAHAAIAVPGNSRQHRTYQRRPITGNRDTGNRNHAPIGKWPGVQRMMEELATSLRRSRFVSLPITSAHIPLAGGLKPDYRDPLGRISSHRSRLRAGPASASAATQSFAMPPRL